MQDTLPKEFLDRIHTQFKDEYEDFKNSLSLPSPTSIRINPAKSIELDHHESIKSFSSIPWCDAGYYLAERPQFIFDPLFHAGCYYVQEASSMFLSHVLKQIIDPQQDITILDLCAAPGGKSTLINAYISDNSLLVANEVIRGRAGILEENLTKWGKNNFVITSNDPKDFSKTPNFFDVIVIDAPCSGEGMFRKDQGAIKEWSLSNVALCASRQQRIISDIIQSLKPKGYLIYSTCTFAPEENEQNCDWMMNEYGILPVEIPVNVDWNITHKHDLAHTYHFYPHKTVGEGLFMACFRKPEDSENTPKGKYQFQKSVKLDFVQKKILPEISKWIAHAEQYEFINRNDSIYAVLLSQIEKFKAINSSLYITYPGICIGRLVGEQLIPAHELALNKALNPNIISINLPRDQALIYLKKGDVSTFEAVQNIPNGWVIVKYKDYPLGWIKKIGNRTNNYFPKELRILKDL